MPLVATTLRALAQVPTSVLAIHRAVELAERGGDVVGEDDDRVVVAPREKAASVVARAQAIRDREEKVRKALAAGQTTIDVLGLRSRFSR